MTTKKLAVIAIALGVLGLTCGMALAQPAIPTDPLQDPAAAFDDFRALTKIGWPVTVLAGVVVAARLLGRFVPRLSMLAGKPAAVIAAVASVGASAFDVLALGGSWASVVMAALVAAAALWNPQTAAAPAADGDN